MKTPIVTFVSIAVTAVLADNPKAIPFGLSGPAQILTPLDTVKNVPEHNRSGNNVLGLSSTEAHEAKFDPGAGEDPQYDVDEDAYDEDDEDDEDDFSLNFDHPSHLFKRQNGQTEDCGVFVVDCAFSPATCQNACYYQNCVVKDPNLRYQDALPSARARNRIDAGTTVSTGTPCKNMPLSQKFYDTWPGWENLAVKDEMQTDEWPQASFAQMTFGDLAQDPNGRDLTLPQGTVRNSLRCLKGTDNGVGGQQYRFFRQRQKFYNTGSTGRTVGKYANRRTCNRRVFNGAQTFTIEFDLSGMSQTDIDDLVPYCKPQPNCQNDGRQFHMSTLRYKGDGIIYGNMDWKADGPYDSGTMNRYTMTGENTPIEAYHVVVQISTTNSEQYKAKVNTYSNGVYTEAGSASSDNLAVDQTLTVTGLPRDLVITPRADGTVDFEYGNETTDRLAHYKWNSDDAGFDRKYADGSYCALLPEVKDTDGDVIATEFECWFPGW